MTLGPGGDVKAIAFDWGGVFTEGTFDSRASRALAQLYGVPLARMEAAYFPLMEEFEVGAFDLPTFQGRLVHDLGVADAPVGEVDEETFRTTFLTAARDRQPTFDLLAGIPVEYAVGMLSNNVAELCDRVRSDPRASRIETFVFSNEIGARKPDAAAFTALAEALAVPREATVFVDDNPTNVAAAEAFGYRGLLFDDPHGFGERWRTVLPELAHLVDGPSWSS